MLNEPQSYGSQGEWVSGKTGQEVNRPKSETSAPHQGGDVSEVQTGDNPQLDARASDDEITAVKGVSGQETGAKRSSFFKDRDYRA